MSTSMPVSSFTIQFIKGEEMHREARSALYDIISALDFSVIKKDDLKILRNTKFLHYNNIPLFTAEYILPIAQVVAPALGTILVSWLQGRAGRKVRLKVGDIEIEARDPEQLEQLLIKAIKIKSDSESPG